VRLGGWKYERIREDKKLPNDIKTVESIKASALRYELTPDVDLRRELASRDAELTASVARERQLRRSVEALQAALAESLEREQQARGAHLLKG